MSVRMLILAGHPGQGCIKSYENEEICRLLDEHKTLEAVGVPTKLANQLLLLLASIAPKKIRHCD